MDSGILTKYSASAGSGKTTELTREYLSKLFRSLNSYRKILAVTFTNKAASEMKGRILDQLYLISKGNRSDEAASLASLTKKSSREIEYEAKKILDNILHDYSRFSVGTIDSFFQKVLKAFTRESGLQSGYLIELDHSLILSAAVDNMMSDIGNDKALLEWIAEFAKTRVEDGKTWKIKDEIISMAEELFREKYKLLQPSQKEKLGDRNLLAVYVMELKSLRSEFFSHIRSSGDKIRQLLDKHVVTDDMFFQGKKGIPSFLRRISTLQIDTSEPLNSYVLKVLENPPRWSTNPLQAPQLAEALRDGLDEHIKEAVRYFNENFMTVNTADAILSNVYTLGILSDILDNVHEITTSENKFLLSDAGELLYLIIGNDQTPFIYEKIGNNFENYMIDEFQDTSAIQWKNFKPLIDNSMGEGFDNLVVGDIKQSIYRWRNSDWRIFDKIIYQDIGSERLKIEKLDTNYRSRENIVAFNNTVFSVVPEYIDNQYENENARIRDLYADAQQNSGGKKEGGYVNFDFLEEPEEEKFKDIVLRKLPGIIENLQDKGYKGSDIGILVRWNNEGSDILKYMLDYRSSVDEEKRKRYNYEIISNESLILDQNPVVCFIISLLTWLYDPSDNISRALILRNWLLATGKDISEAESLLIDYTDNETANFFPSGYDRLIEEIRHLSLFESVETIISFFSLGSYPGNSAYLNSFQDCVLDFSAANSPEAPAFLEWWTTTGSKKSVVLSEQQDSVRVMTIHKAKGLQFRVVILPFLTWQLNHDKNPTIWIKPETSPFNNMGLVPVKYKKSLIYSHFADAYNEEKFSSIVDNLNLVYVAFTRAVDCLIGFCPEKTGNRSLTVGSVLKKAMQSDAEYQTDKPSLALRKFFDISKSSFSYGKMPEKVKEVRSSLVNEVSVPGYEVNISLNRLRLKFHGENFLVTLSEDQSVKLNYGRIMHEVFSLISTADDVQDAVLRLVLEGKIPDSQRDELVRKILEVISSPGVKQWFETGSVLIKEADILLPSGSTKRPDRILLKDNGAIIIDFKFGIEKPDYINQVINYRKLMNEMGYNKVEAFLWYVDINKVIAV
jgi:ATP-dependent exoDNAse (exonuclease V) beta subunit